MQHGEPGLAVVGADGRFHGLIAPQRLLAVLLAEHDEDIARLGGFLHTTDEARTASTEPVSRRLWHRLPWLLVGLAGALAAAGIVGAFETQLQRNVLVAFFVPEVVHRGCRRPQTEALVIRVVRPSASVSGRLSRGSPTGLLVGCMR